MRQFAYSVCSSYRRAKDRDLDPQLIYSEKKAGRYYCLERRLGVGTA